MMIASLRLLLAAALPAIAACSGSAPGPWQKPNADAQTTAGAESDCLASAKEEALRRYPYGAGSPGLGAGGLVASEQSDATNRAITEAALLNTCMQNRGYRRGSP